MTGDLKSHFNIKLAIRHFTLNPSLLLSTLALAALCSLLRVSACLGSDN